MAPTSKPESINGSVVRYVIAAFVISWIVGIILFFPLFGLEKSLGFYDKPFSLLIGKYGPSLAGFLMMYFAGGWKGTLSLLRKALVWKVSPIYYCIALFLPVAVKLAVFLIGEADMASFEIHLVDLGPLTLVVMQYLFLGGGFGEEFGWRGYMLPKLNERYKPLITTMIIGVVWIAWHIPAYFLGNKGDESPIILFAIFVMSASVLLTWLYYKTNQSVLLVALYHAAYNASSDWVVILLGKDHEVLGFSEYFLGWAESLITLGIALILIVVTRGRLGMK